MLQPYLHQHPEWPHLRWDHTALEPLLRRTRTRRDHLNARVESLGIPLTEQMHLDTLSSDVVKTSEIEGETLNLKAVRSSVAWRLGILPEGVPSGDDAVEGIVQITADATFNHAAPLSEERLFEWHAALFPAGRSAGRPITVGGWRVHPIQVVSGAIGQERVHFEGPDHQRVPEEMTRFLQWLNSPPESGLTVHAALAHLRFVTIHPFDDGNGRIARAVSDMLLTRDDGNPRRLYSMSAQIHTDRAQYYRMLEETQRAGTARCNSLDRMVPGMPGPGRGSQLLVHRPGYCKGPDPAPEHNHIHQPAPAASAGPAGRRAGGPPAPRTAQCPKMDPDLPLQPGGS